MQQLTPVNQPVANPVFRTKSLRRRSEARNNQAIASAVRASLASIESLEGRTLLSAALAFLPTVTYTVAENTQLVVDGVKIGPALIASDTNVSGTTEVDQTDVSAGDPNDNGDQSHDFVTNGVDDDTYAPPISSDAEPYMPPSVPADGTLSVGPALDPAETAESNVINDDGTFIYTPNANFVGKDQFTYYIFNNANGNPDANTASPDSALSPDVSSKPKRPFPPGKAPPDTTPIETQNNSTGAVTEDVGTVIINVTPSTTTSPPTTTTGSLIGNSSTAGSSYSLTTLGTTDWAHWGLGGNGSAFDDKSSGGTQISNVTRLGSGSYGGYQDSSRTVSWTDGTPVASDSADHGYIWANNALGAGYSFTVPADTTSRTIYVYLGGYDSTGTLTATLSDSSAPPYTISYSGAAHYSDIAQITYSAASAGQTLTLSYVKAAGGVIGGSVDLDAAMLAAPASSGRGSVVGTPSPAAASYNLTTLGTKDWAHWGLRGNAAAFDDKSTGGSQISNVTRVGSGSYGGYQDSSRTVSWSNGTPVSTDSGDQGYIWANNAIGAGYSFTVPADTTTRTVYVYLGGYSSGGTLTAHLSDGSTSDYQVSFSGASHYSDVVAITYNAASAGQTLKLTYVKSQNIAGTGGSVDLIAAWLE